MSAITVGGRTFAAGLCWLERGGAGATARTARRLGRPWYVHRRERTGFAAVDPACGPEGLDPAGLPALALALLDCIDGEFWMALVEGDAAPSDGGRRYALVKARGGAVLADGDEVFNDRAAALKAFERARTLGWMLYATPRLRAETLGPEIGGADIAALDTAALGEAASKAGESIALERAAARRAGLRPVPALLGLAALAAIAAVWFEGERLLEWLVAPATAPAPAEPPPDPELPVSVDGTALILACRQGLIEHPPFLPGWRIERIDCAGRFADGELSALVPELSGRAVLLVRWRLEQDHAEVLQRRVAERHLSSWHAAAVAGARAWAAVPLGPVLRIADVPAPPFLALRRAVDRSFGARGTVLGYVRDADGGWRIAIEDPGPMSSLAALAGGIGGLEATALSRGAQGGWRLEARPLAPERMTASRLRALGVAGGGSRVQDGSKDGKEVPHGTRNRDDG